eukprot:scaffold14982_cov62-Phaeocystis_antarctica.AAC.1
MAATHRPGDALQAGSETGFGRRSESGERGAQPLQAHPLVVPPGGGHTHVHVCIYPAPRHPTAPHATPHRPPSRLSRASGSHLAWSPVTSRSERCWGAAHVWRRAVRLR